MNILTPIVITDSMIGAGTTIPEDPTAAWVSGTSYTVGQEVHRTTTHRVYRCAAATSGTTPPEQAITNWVDVRPTNRWAPFDYYSNTRTSITNTGTFVFQNLGSFNAIYIRNLAIGKNYTLNIKDSLGNSIYFFSGVAVNPPDGWYEYFFQEQRPLGFILFDNLLIPPGVTVEFTIVGAPGAPATLGLFVIGDLVPLSGYQAGSGVERGASVEPITYSYIGTDDDGTVTIKRRFSATNLRLSCTVPINQADAAVSQIQNILDVPVAVVASTQDNLQQLSTFGLVSGSVTYDYTTANISINVKGLV